MQHLRRFSCLFAAILLLMGGESLAQQNGQWMRGSELTWDPTAQATNPNLTYHALVIGISDYQEMAGAKPWADLETAANDARGVAEVLETKYGFQVTALIDSQATREAILTELDKISSLKLNEGAVIYFAGHGQYDQKLGEGYWIPHDARSEVNGRPAKADWVWNSQVNTFLGGSEARHILVIADSCYGASLFRGSPPRSTNQDLQWYKRVNAKPSRYLITSGDVEPVVDTGGAHSVFAQNVIDYLTEPEKPIFAASDLGFAVRQKVSTATGQMVRMGPLSLPSDAGGELVFIARSAGIAAP